MKVYHVQVYKQSGKYYHIAEEHVFKQIPKMQTWVRGKLKCFVPKIVIKQHNTEDMYFRHVYKRLELRSKRRSLG